MQAVRRWLGKYGARSALGLLLTLAAALYPLGFWRSHAIDRQDTMLADLRMRLAPATLDPRVVIVDIDSKSLDEVGRFPWPRKVLAQLVDQLAGHYGAGAIGFDVSFPEPDHSSGYGVLRALADGALRDVPGLPARLQALSGQLDYDGLFAQALRGRPVVLGYNLAPGARKGALPPPAFAEPDLNGREVWAYSSTGYEANIARLQQAAANAGIFTVNTDPDGVVRSAALLMKIGDAFYPSLSLATVAAYLKAEQIVPDLGQERGRFGLDGVLLFGADGVRPVPLGEALTTVVQYHGPGGPHGGAFRYVSAADVLAGRVPAAWLKGAIVLVGTTAPGLQDLRVTPVNKDYPGVEVHANVIRSILDGRFKLRPAAASFYEAGQVLAAGALLALALPLLPPLAAALLALAAFGALGGANYYLYSQHDMVLNVFIALALVVLLFVLNLGWGYFFELRKSRALVSRFGEYVAPELVARMADNPDAYTMDGESRALSVMFVDVRGFTTISEGLTPKALREYINLYLTAMSEDIRGLHQGTLDKYIGDAVMAFWGAPVAFDDHARRAVATALAMQASAARLNQEFLQRGWPELKIGIGVNSGLMHVGDMGSAIRRAYTVMGDAVNLTSRLEGITKAYGVGIVVGEATRAAAPGFAYRELDLVRVKGKHEPVAIFEPLGLAAALDAAAQARLAAWHVALAQVRAQQWDAAEAALGALAQDDPHPLYALYLARIAHYRATPPGADWDGVTTFETK